MGECSCGNGAKLCGYICIPQTSCCDDIDCPGDLTCIGSNCGCDGGGPCIGIWADGSPCANPSECQSGYCANGFCCQGGVCCDQDLDCPASFSSTSTCDDSTLATNCQGTRLDARCLANVCTSEAAPDDFGCDGYEHTCPNNFAPVVCTADFDQAPPVCASACVTDAVCAAGHICQARSCVLQVATGDPCGGQGTCNTGLECENNVCCDLAAGTCCDNDAVCTGGLACNTVTATCYETCNDLDSSRCADPGDVCLNDTCAAKAALGTPCNDPAECQSNNCVDGVCCDDPCTGVCQACGAGGLCDDTPADDAACSVDCDPFDDECLNYYDLTANRCDSFGQCKVATLANCIIFANIPAGTACGSASATNCDAADTCDGAGSCVDRVDPVGTVCRADASDCDRPEICDGGTKSCPNDVLELPGTPCGSASNSGCDEPDTCNSSGTCVDNIDSAGTVCRADMGECDVAEICDGSSKICPTNSYEPSGTACGSSSSSDCDAADTCNSTGSCIDRVDSSRTVCRADAGECDVAETCDGSSKTCPSDSHEPGGTACGSSNSSGCDAPDECNRSGNCIDLKDPAGTSCSTCRTCDSFGSCSVNVPDGFTCGDPFGCSECQSGLCVDQCGSPQICCGPGSCVCSTCACK